MRRLLSQDLNLLRLSLFGDRISMVNKDIETLIFHIDM
jgi:hypothetical protein